MVYFIYPTDDTTAFLLDIPKRIAAKVGSDKLEIITIFPNDSSYTEALEKITQLPKNSLVVFMGHGQADKLWGAESAAFEKKPFVSKSQAKVFSDKFLFCLSCNSNDFLRGTFGFSKIINSVGFGSLPTEMVEVQNSKKLKEMGVNEEVINQYKEILVELVSESFSRSIKDNSSFNELSSFFSLLLNRKISQVVLDDKKSQDKRVLSDLLFQMKSEMIFI